MDTFQKPPFFSMFKQYFRQLKSGTDRTITNDIKKIMNQHLLNSKKYRVSTQEHWFNPNTNPFFYQPETQEFKGESLNWTDMKKELSKIDNEIVFNPYILSLYILTGNTQKEIVIGNYEIYSFGQLCHKITQYRKDGLTYVDVGHKSLGMGHVDVLRMDVENGGLFIQPDGGSSGYERQLYWEKYKNQKVSESEHIIWSEFLEKAFEPSDF